jgi:hypothetical protein
MVLLGLITNISCGPDSEGEFLNSKTECTSRGRVTLPFVLSKISTITVLWPDNK